MKKNYGVCKLLGGDDFEVLIEYKYDVKMDGEGKHIIIVGKDIITGEKIRSVISSKRLVDLDMAVQDNIIDTHSLVVLNYEKIEEPEMLSRLKTMTQEDAKTYVFHIKRIKQEYLQAINMKKYYQDENKRSIKNEIKRIRRQVYYNK